MMRLGGAAAVGPHQPAVRGAYMRLFSNHVDRLPADARAAVRATVAENTWQEIERAGMFTWLPVEVNLACTRAVGEQLPAADMTRFFRTLLLDTAHSPLLHGLVESVLRIAVRDPGLYLVWVTRGYQLLFRNAGSWDVLERAPGRAHLLLRGAPSACAADPLWLESLRGGLLSLFDLKSLSGDIRILAPRSDPGVSFEASWAPA